MTAEYVRGPDLLWRNALDETLVRHLDGRTAVLRGVASSIWVCLSGTVTSAELAARVREASSLHRGLTDQEVEQVLAELEAEGLVTRA